MCYLNNIPGEVDFMFDRIISVEAKRVNLTAIGYGFINGNPSSYGRGAICADLDDILPYMKD